jgi:tight adherence protein C
MDLQLIPILAGLVVVGTILVILVLVIRGSAPMPEESRLDGLSSLGTQTSRNRSRSHSASKWSQPRSESGSQDKSEAFGDRMIQAGLYRKNSMSFYVVTKIILALVPIAAGVAVGLMGLVTMQVGIGIGAILCLVGLIVPSMWLDSMKRSRQQQISRALPDALDVIVVCLEAGLSLRAAITRVGKELKTAHPMLAGELIIVNREIQLGHSGGEALKRLAGRFDLESLRSLASVVLQAEKFGASIAGALRVHAEDMRIKRFQHAEELAQKASVKLLFPTMFLIFPTLYVILIGPAVIEMVSFFEEFSAPTISK